MITHALAWLLILALGPSDADSRAPAVPTARPGAIAPPAPTPAPAVTVTVDAQALGEFADEVEAEIEAGATAVLRTHPEGARAITITVDWLDTEAFDYVITVRRADTPRPHQLTCHHCNTTELVETTIDGLERPLPPDRPAVAPPPPAPRAPTGCPGPGCPLAREEPPRTRPLAPLGWAGVGLLATGAAAGITGAVLAGSGERRPSTNKSLVRDLRTPGLAIVGAAAAVIMTGAVLLAVDRGRARRRTLALRRGPPGARFLLRF